MKEKDGQREIRSLLKIGSPSLALIDSLGEIEGKLFQISGGSNSGKSNVVMSLIEELNRSKLDCAFFDIENSGLYSRGFYRNKLNKNIKVFCPITVEEFLNSLKECAALGLKAIAIDYLNLIEGINFSVSSKLLKSFAEEHGMFVITAMHSRKTSDQMFKDFFINSDFSAVVSKLGSEISLTLIDKVSQSKQTVFYFND